MAKSLYGHNPADDLLPRAETGVFPERAAAAEPARRPYVDPPVPEAAGPVAAVAVPQDMRGYVLDLWNEINRLAADGVVRLELDGSGEHARLVVLMPKQRVTWEPIDGQD